MVVVSVNTIPEYSKAIDDVGHDNDAVHRQLGGYAESMPAAVAGMRM